jgi:phosphate transport system protein
MAASTSVERLMTEHTVRAFDEDLKHMTDLLTRMGGLVEQQLAGAINALMRRDVERAAQIMEADRTIDRLEDELDSVAVRVLALRHPMAVDLRLIMTALKVASDLERMGDYAANVAKRTLTLAKLDPVQPVAAIPGMARIVQEMVHDVLDALIERDLEKALAVWRRDEEVDDRYNGLFRELLTYMMEDPRHISPCTHLLFIAKNIERIGDHATNIAEQINFLVKGKTVEEMRPKGDVTAFETPA